MKRSEREPRPLPEILQRLFATLGWEGRLREAEILKRWEEAVGHQIARRTTPSHIRDHRLTVVVDSSVWAQQLALMKKDLLARFDGILGEGVIRDLYVVSGRVNPSPQGENRLGARAPAIDDESCRQIEEEASRIPDGDLREAFLRTFRAANRRGRSRR